MQREVRSDAYLNYVWSARCNLNLKVGFVQEAWAHQKNDHSDHSIVSYIVILVNCQPSMSMVGSAKKLKNSMFALCLTLGYSGYGWNWLEILELVTHFQDHVFQNHVSLPPNKRDAGMPQNQIVL